MKRNPIRAASIFPILCLSLFLLLSCGGGKGITEDYIASLSAEQRAVLLLSLAEENFAKADSFQVSAKIEASLPSGSASLKWSETVTERGTASYTHDAQQTLETELGGKRTAGAEKSGYRDGVAYLSSSSGETTASLRSPMTEEQYLLHQRETAKVGVLDAAALLDGCRKSASQLGSDGLYRISLTDFSEAALASIRQSFAPLLAELEAGGSTLVGAAVTLHISRDRYPASVETSLVFLADGAQLSVTASIAYTEIGAARPPETSEIAAYRLVPDLRLLYLIESELARAAEREQGAYRFSLSRTYYTESGESSYGETELGSYGQAEGGSPFFEILRSVDSLAPRVSFSYAEGSLTTAQLGEGGLVLAAGQNPMTDAEARSYLARRINFLCFSRGDVSAVSKTGPDTYLLTLHSLDLSALASLDLGELRGWSATVEVRLEGGRLARLSLTLTVKGTGARLVRETQTVELLDRLPE